MRVIQKLSIPGLLVLFANSTYAQSQDSAQMFYNMLLYALAGIAILLTIVIFYLYRLVITIGKEINKTEEEVVFQKAYEEQTLWEKLLSLKPLAFENRLVLHHEYDGIKELDNPTPPWFNFLFYGTIIFGIVYMFIYHVAGDGNIQETEYKQEVAIAMAAQEELMKKAVNSINEDNAKILTDASALEEGKAIYTKNCVACHSPTGAGGVGPNLTDEYWIHGKTPKNIFHTISEGVIEKGMIAWKKQLNPAQIQKVASYIVMLQGTNPAGGKEPQGNKDGFTNSESVPSIPTTTDSTTQTQVVDTTKRVSN
ncbi:MAG: cbb3-type cytochrome c oxidase N-terminal domain-containing protein [Bacteroidota bacterium]|nr:cbb3-type cytochrome c oxidase N-terminal domain-containing protein [Bacteroidota bacterium]